VGHRKKTTDRENGKEPNKIVPQDLKIFKTPGVVNAKQQRSYNKNHGLLNFKKEEKKSFEIFIGSLQCSQI
jgi:hypothetical protein